MRTIAGVLTALTIPARTVINSSRVHETSRVLLDSLRDTGMSERDILGVDEQEAIVEGLERNPEQVQSPLNGLLHGLAPWIGFGVMPLFALANAGVVLDGDLARAIPAT